MQRNRLFTTFTLLALITLSSTLALAQSQEQRGWAARRALAGQGQIEKPVETSDTAVATELELKAAARGGDILNTIEAAKEARRKALVGAWRINIPQSDSGLPPFNALHVFHTGGTFTEVSDLLPGLAETPAKGVWDVADADRYLLTFELFVFDAEKKPAGMVRVRASLKLVNPNEFLADSVVDFIAPDGTVEMGIDKSPFTGKRIKVTDIK